MKPEPDIAEAQPGKDRTLTIYCAAALGAFCLGLTDLLKNGTRAIVLELGQLFREMILPSWENVPLLALFILVGLGAAMCWLFQPPTRIDAFARGFSVFAVLAVATPGTDPPPLDASGGLLDPAAIETLEPTAEGVAPAVAVPARPWAPRAAGLEPSDPLVLALRQKWDRRPPGYGLAGIRIETAGEGATVAAAKLQITLRDPRSARIVGVERSEDGRFLILQPKGRYLVEVEALGHRRTSFELELGDEVLGYSLVLEQAGVPLGLQRLVAAKRIEPETTALRLD